MRFYDVDVEDIKYINDYIDEMAEYTTNLEHVSYVDYEGIRYFLAIDNSCIIVAYIEEGEMKSMCFSANDIDNYTSDNKVFTISGNTIVAQDYVNGVIEVLKIYPAINAEGHILEFHQLYPVEDFKECYYAEELIFTYYVPGNRDLVNVINYTYFHTPSVIELTRPGKYDRMFNKNCFLKMDDDNYAKQAININGNRIAKGGNYYSIDAIKEVLAKYKFEIPTYLKNYADQNSEEKIKVKRLQKGFLDFIDE